MTPARMLNLSWIAFFLTFLVWFNLAPFMTTLREEFGLSKGQLTVLMVANLALTIPARIVVGYLTDRFGPRRTFAILLWGCALPVLWCAFARSFSELLVARVLISVVGAGFVVGIRMMREWYPPSKIGMAEGIYAGWGNFGSAAGSFALPILAAWGLGWRGAVALTAVLCATWGLVYWRWAVDSPTHYHVPQQTGTLRLLRNRQMQVLALSYFVSFGGELAVVSMLPAFMQQTFDLSVTSAGMLASSFAFMNLVARPGGGWISDRLGRVRTMVALSAGLALGYGLLSGLGPSWPLVLAVVAVMGCSFFVQSSEGAAFAIAPFVDPKHSGQIAGMIGAAGNLGSIAFLFLLGATTPQTFFFVLALTAGASAIWCAIGLREPEATSHPMDPALTVAKS